MHEYLGKMNYVLHSTFPYRLVGTNFRVHYERVLKHNGHLNNGHSNNGTILSLSDLQRMKSKFIVKTYLSNSTCEECTIESNMWSHLTVFIIDFDDTKNN